MATLTFEDLKGFTQVYLQNWCAMGVKDEPLTAMDAEGSSWVSFWDNWLLPPDPDGLAPLITVNGLALSDSQYTIVQAGNAVRGIITITPPIGEASIVLATYLRATFRNSFWENNLKAAIFGMQQRLLIRITHPTSLQLDDMTDPWHLVVKQAGKNALVSLQTLLAGFGKTALPLDAGILTPTGWGTMGDMQIGDYVVSSSGFPCMVTGVYPQGIKDVYCVTFSDGSSVECTLDHLWTTKRRDRWYKDEGWAVRSLGEIKDTLKTSDGASFNHAIPMCAPIRFDSQPLPIDPYLLGALIGDGGVLSGVTFHNTEQAILDEVQKLLPKDVDVVWVDNPHCPTFRIKKKSHIRVGDGGEKNSLTLALIELSLFKHNCYTKFIPDVYKFSSIENRIALLQGLMDTDGFCAEDGMAMEYSTSSAQLALDFQFLVESLGGVCRIRSRKPSYSYKEEKLIGATSYRLNPSFPPEIIPFRKSQHKLERFVPKSKYLPHRVARSIELVGAKEVQCITVDAPDCLYMTNHCILTHNSMESVTVDLSRAHNMIHEVIADLAADIDREVVAWRWANSPMARRAYMPGPVNGPWPGNFGGLY